MPAKTETFKPSPWDRCKHCGTSRDVVRRAQRTASDYRAGLRKTPAYPVECTRTGGRSHDFRPEAARAATV